MFLNIAAFVALFIGVSRAFELQPRIFRGKDSLRGQFPYYVLLEEVVADVNKSLCGASLIDERWVLTAAHCIYNRNRLYLHFGSLSIKNESENGRVMMAADRENFIIHPSYNQHSLLDDIGLIKLPKPVQLSSYIRPIGFDRKYDLDDIFNVTVVGDGYQSNIGPDPLILQYAYLETIRLADCKEKFPHVKNRLSVRCAHGLNSESACIGDSGGPVITTKTGKLLGVLSFMSSQGCEHGLPLGFSNLASYQKWIEFKTGLKL